ncbi:unnamed protein product [Ambrosiozyma monospora]|uniref:Unnamed protein product n=1 Tax=Ambrosiozyma monospora TaxID=43982 RepID=A0A9W7DH90_AMBMO|nr:unnamed protein product [Ambrosiozyma monospora]
MVTAVGADGSSSYNLSADDGQGNTYQESGSASKAKVRRSDSGKARKLKKARKSRKGSATASSAPATPSSGTGSSAPATPSNAYSADSYQGWFILW